VGPALPTISVPPESIETQLERILRSGTFAKAERLSDFLRYVVRESLAGRADQLKEYTIALDVFGRPSSFDPHRDSVVRVAARSLRTKLHDYYDGDGREDPVVIELPKGGYEPVFRERESPALATASTTDGASPSSPSPTEQAVSGVRSDVRPPWRRYAIVVAAVVAIVSCVAGLAYWAWRSRPLKPIVLAVLPFDIPASTEDEQVFAEGLVDELTMRLAGIDGVQVMAHTTSRLVKAAKDPVAEAARLGIDAVVDGGVNRAASTVRITVQVVDSSSRLHLFSDRYDRQAQEGFLVQDEIAFNIATALQTKLGLSGATRPRAPANPEAVRLYWTGRFIRRQARPDAMPRSAELFEQATALDPRYADAWAALADVYEMMGYHQTSGRTTDAHVALARAAAGKALALDNRSVEALSALAHLAFYFDRDWPAAERTFRQALKLNPSSSKTRQRYASGLLTRGRFDEAIEHSRAARMLDPLSMTISNDLGVMYYIAGRYDDAQAASMQVLAADPKFAPAHALIGLCLGAQGKPTAAIAEIQKAIDLTERFSYLLGHLGRAYARSGNRTAALDVLKELTTAPDQSAVSNIHVAYILAALGERERAIDALERGVARYDADAIYIGVDPALAELREDPRYLRLLERLRLPNVK
jgi:TolB-like protein/tetratricopeptide (TPR) repeat protein